MATLSRTKKYQDLRDSLQHEGEADSLSTNDLSRFEKRLNEIDAQNFSLPQNYMKDDHVAEHARTHDSNSDFLSRYQSKQEPSFDTSSYYTNENDVTFDNDYLDQYIREVKQYNIDQGNASSENTQINILKQIERNNGPLTNRPYVRSKKTETSEIPFMNYKNDSANVSSTPSIVNEAEEEVPQGNVNETQSLTKEDIMAEVQNLVNGPSATQASNPASDDKEFPFVTSRDHDSMSTDTFNRRLEADRTTRQQLLNETTQMRAQLDDYEDNLSEVSDKMRQTSKILNIVLVILIIALAILLGVVIYWIMISR